MFFNIFRWLIAIILGIIYSILLTFTVLMITVVLTFSDRHDTKTWLAETSLYENAFDIGISLIGQNSDGQEDENDFISKISDPTSEIHQAVYDLATPLFIEESVNKVIDGLYDWIEGKTATPIFVIELTDDDDELERIIILSLEEKARGLPICQDYIGPNDFDPLSDECRPASYDINEVGNYLSDISDTREFQELKDDFKIDSEDFIEVTPGLTEQVQLGYTIFRYSPLIAGLLSLLFGLFYAGMIPGKVRGLISMGTVALLVGGILAAFTYYSYVALDYLYSDLVRDLVEVESDEVYELAEELATNMVNGFSDTLRIVSMVVAGIGLLLIIVVFLIDKYKGRKKRKMKMY